jgi:DNA-binding NtrC family response regulator
MPIADHYLSVFAKANKKTITGFSVAAKQALLDYAWPGNVRELINPVERNVLLCESEQIDNINLPALKLKRAADVNRMETITRMNATIFWKLWPNATGKSTVSMMCFDKQKYSLNQSLDQITNSVSPDHFFRVNRKYLINFKAIKEVEHYFQRKLFVSC